MPVDLNFSRLATNLFPLAAVGLALVAGPSPAGAQDAAEQPARRNIVLVLSDDHRYDFLGFMDRAPSFLETPTLDRLAREGMHVANAFVSTSLCSPSRASILTGQYMHRHKVVDNQRPVPEGTVFFPKYLQDAGYETAFIGKWHMGHEKDDPRPGFDYWASFKGQGRYFDPEININGTRKQFNGYNADVLSKLAVTWLTNRKSGKPFFLMVSFKAVHYPFLPATRHKGRYADKPIDYPHTMANTERNYASQPRWVRERRYSIHGIDHMETGAFDKDPVPDFDALYRGYAEAVHSLDQNVGRVLDGLHATGVASSSLLLYMGDNGFHLGEHGFYDKRDAFETSIRVPMLAWAPGLIRAGSKISQMVQNIDLAPTLLSAAGAAAPASARFDGRSFLPMLVGAEDQPEWREHILYEYHWEWNFPATPTTFAIRGSRYKFIYYHGTWDIDGFYDLETDPIERHNLIRVPAYKQRIAAMRKKLFDWLEESGGTSMPLRRPAGARLDQRKLRR